MVSIAAEKVKFIDTDVVISKKMTGLKNKPAFFKWVTEIRE